MLDNGTEEEIDDVIGDGEYDDQADIPEEEKDIEEDGEDGEYEDDEEEDEGMEPMVGENGEPVDGLEQIDSTTNQSVGWTFTDVGMYALAAVVIFYAGKRISKMINSGQQAAH